MKHLHFIIYVLLLLGCPVFAQDKQGDCQDVVRLKDGSLLRGKITEYNAGADLVINTWSGLQMRVPVNTVKSINQKCREVKKPVYRPYSFEEQGWYHATRVFMLPGESGIGFGLQHSSGLKLNRYLGIGAGAGLENFDPGDSDVATFPIFAEVRGYLLAKNITPFYALGAGYGFSKRTSEQVFIDGPSEEWRGGWMAQGQIGYRIGNHAFVQIGIRLQHKTRIWENSFWSGNSGVDQILHKRLDFGIGLLL